MYLLFHPVPLLGTSAIMCYVLYRRMFASDASPRFVHRVLRVKIVQMMKFPCVQPALVMQMFVTCM